MLISINVDYSRWNEENINFEDIINNTCKKVEGILEINKNDELSVLLTNDQKIKELNKQYRNQDKPTNVLSFVNDKPLLGDVVISFNTLKNEALQQKKLLNTHFTHIFLHGLLHLLGYDHINKHEADEMESLEIEILAELNIKNPYLDYD